MGLIVGFTAADRTDVTIDEAIDWAVGGGYLRLYKEWPHEGKREACIAEFAPHEWCFVARAEKPEAEGPATSAYCDSRHEFESWVWACDLTPNHEGDHQNSKAAIGWANV